MPRNPRIAIGNTIYHVLNRGNGRHTIFNNEKDYQHFETLLEEANELLDMRILAYCLMPNHWHLVLYPKKDKDLSEFMRWLTTTHARQYRVKTKSIGHGHLYQGSYKSFPVAKDHYLTTLIRYVEQNPLRAQLVKRAQDWTYGSLHRRLYGTLKQKKLLAKLPTTLPQHYLKAVNTLYDKTELTLLRNSAQKGIPYGDEQWASQFMKKNKY
jgi:putative transposase